MASTFKGYDPELGKKFSDESSGLVIGRAKSSPRKSEAQAIEEYSQEHGRAPDAQQLHDWMMSSSAQTETEQDGIRAEALRRAQVRKMVDDSIKRSQGIPTGPSKAPLDPTRK